MNVGDDRLTLGMPCFENGMATPNSLVFVSHRTTIASTCVSVGTDVSSGQELVGAATFGAHEAFGVHILLK